MKLRWIFLLAVLDAARGHSSGFIFHLIKHNSRLPVVRKIVAPAPTANCICVPYDQCSPNNTTIIDDAEIIDPIRYFTRRKCTGEFEVCCGPPMAPIVTPPGTPLPDTEPIPSPTPPPTTIPPTLPPTSPPTSPPTTMPPTTPPTTMPPTSPPTTMPPTSPPTTMPPTSPPTEPAIPTTTLAPSSNCVCVPIDQCDDNGVIIIGGEGVINPRQIYNPCLIDGQICCKLPTTTKQPQQPVVTPTSSPTQPGICICVQYYQCGANGFIITSEMGNIDPRYSTGGLQAIVGNIVGSCVSPNEICCRIPTSGDNSSPGIPGFPDYPVIAVPNYQGSGVIRYVGTSRACTCVKSWQCLASNVVGLENAGVIDPRFGACPNVDEVCCRVQSFGGILVPVGQGLVINGGNPNVVYVNPNGIVSQPTTSTICGLRSTACTSGQTCATRPGETSFAEFPWMVALFVRPSDGSPLVFRCGASIINTQSILTAAHCVIDRQPGALVARFGEWNRANNAEPAPYQEIDVQAVVTHPLYYKGGLYNDVAVLILVKPIAYAINVMPICLPQQGFIFSPSTQCVVSGWGRNAFQGQYQTILRKVDLPIIDRQDCQTRLRSTRLGQYFQLHGSFICAGGETSKDACGGDGGGPLVCPTGTGRFVQAGIVSWGIGCGESNTPAVYASVSQFRQWIDRQLANHGVS